jgi:ABC-type molybdate transport system substrate-binding protein
VKAKDLAVDKHNNHARAYHQKFIGFLVSEKGKKIYEEYGWHHAE